LIVYTLGSKDIIIIISRFCFERNSSHAEAAAAAQTADKLLESVAFLKCN